MSTITRNDGTQFVIQAYRELIKYKKKSLQSQRIRDIAQQQGQFVRLYKRRTGEYEAVFSAEPGYLLGESIKQYFQQAKNLIFCESTKDNTQLLLVIIKDGHVFADTCISVDQLKAELLPLTTLKIKFQIVVSGNLAHQIAPTAKDNFFFPEALISSYEPVDDPLIPRLPTLPSVKLLPLPLALKAERLSGDSLLTTSLLIITALVSLIGLFTYSAHMNRQPQPTQKSEKFVPYADYIEAMRSPSPTLLIDLMMDLITNLYELPGWSAESIHQTAGNFTVTLRSNGGTLAEMQQWAMRHNFNVDLTTNGVILTAHHAFAARQPFAFIFPLTELSENLIDSIRKNTMESSIHLLQTIQHHDSKESLLTIDLEELSPQQLSLLKNIFSRLPVVLNQIKISINDDSLLHGVIQLSIWGK